MTDPGAYARGVRAQPYGPYEIKAGGITAWFHGPHIVLTFLSSGGASVTITATRDAGAELAEMLAAARAGRSARLGRADILTAEDGAPVLELTARPTTDGAVVDVSLAGSSTHVEVTRAGLSALISRIRSWAP